MRFWDMVEKTREIVEKAEKTDTKYKRYGMSVYQENVMGPGGDIQPTMKAVSHFLSDNFKEMGHENVLQALNTKPDEWYGKWMEYCAKMGVDKNDAVEFGWDWMTSGEGLVTPSENK